MRKIQASSNYLKNQTRKNLAKAALSLIIFGVAFSALILRLLSSFQVAIFEEAALIFLFTTLIAFYFYLRKYRIYSSGWEGEKQVTKLLADGLSDDYYLINDIYLRGRGGDIDHVVLAPGGVFVLETKNWSGNITCHGDEWQRMNKNKFSQSPSRQVKRNAAKIKQIIDNSYLSSLHIRVECIVVFTNRKATLNINKSRVPILKLQQLLNYLSSNASTRRLSREHLEAIGREIAKQKA